MLSDLRGRGRGARGRGAARRCVGARSGCLGAIRARVLHRRTKLHSPASRWVGRPRQRPSLSVAETRSPWYPRQTSSSLVSNQVYQPQKSPILPFCPSHENDQRNRTDGRRAAPVPAPVLADAAGSSDCGPRSWHDLRPGITKADVGLGQGRFAGWRPPSPHDPRSRGVLRCAGRRLDRPQESSGASLATRSGRRIWPQDLAAGSASVAEPRFWPNHRIAKCAAP